eukprot:g2562.t1
MALGTREKRDMAIVDVISEVFDFPPWSPPHFGNGNVHPGGQIGFAVVPLQPPAEHSAYVVDDDTLVGSDAQTRHDIWDEDYCVPSVKGVLDALLEGVKWMSDSFLTTAKLKKLLKMGCARADVDAAAADTIWEAAHATSPGTVTTAAAKRAATAAELKRPFVAFGRAAQLCYHVLQDEPRHDFIAAETSLWHVARVPKTVAVGGVRFEQLGERGRLAKHNPACRRLRLLLAQQPFDLHPDDAQANIEAAHELMENYRPYVWRPAAHGNSTKLPAAGQPAGACERRRDRRDWPKEPCVADADAVGADPANADPVGAGTVSDTDTGMIDAAMPPPALPLLHPQPLYAQQEQQRHHDIEAGTVAATMISDVYTRAARHAAQAVATGSYYDIAKRGRVDIEAARRAALLAKPAIRDRLCAPGSAETIMLQREMELFHEQLELHDGLQDANTRRQLERTTSYKAALTMAALVSSQISELLEPSQ